MKLKSITFSLLILSSTFSFSQGSAVARGVKQFFNLFKKPPPPVTRIKLPPKAFKNGRLINSSNVYSITDGFYYSQQKNIWTNISKQKTEWKSLSRNNRLSREDYFFDNVPTEKNIHEMLENHGVLDEISKSIGITTSKDEDYIFRGFHDVLGFKYNYLRNRSKLVYNYQKRNKIPFLKYTDRDSEMYQLSAEGLEKFLIEYNNVRSKLKIHQNLCDLIDSENKLNFLTNKYINKWNEKDLITKPWSLRYYNNDKKEYLLEQLTRQYRNQPESANKNQLAIRIKKLKDEISQDLDNKKKYNEFLKNDHNLTNDPLNDLNFKILNEIVEKETSQLIEKINSIEYKLNLLGLLDRQNNSAVKIIISDEKILEEEIKYLTDRLKKGATQFKNDFNLPNYTDYLILDNKLTEIIDAYDQKLSKILRQDENKSVEDKLKEYYIATSKRNKDGFFLDKSTLELIDRDIKEDFQYVKINGKYERLTKKKEEIKIKRDSVKLMSVVSLFPKSKLLIEETKDLPKTIELIRSNLRKKYDKEDIKVVLFSNKKSKRKKDVIIDSLKNLFGKKSLTVIYTIRSSRIKRKLERELRQNKGKNYFFLGHIDQGAFLGKSNTRDYQISFSYLEEICTNNNIKRFYGGCSSSYYNVSGTTDVINDLNFGVHLAKAIKENSSFEGLLKDLSKQKINGGIEEVKFLLNNKSFTNTLEKDGEILFKRNDKLNKLADFFLKYF